MKASTHVEVYRRFTGQLQERRWNCLPIAGSGLRVAFKSRWSLLLFLPPLIATVIFSFVVYAKFALEQGLTPGALVGPQQNPGVALVGAMASKMLEVRDMILGFVVAMGSFSILLSAWYGAGLIAEDRRAGAHLLYFARPLSKLDYVFGKLCVVSVFVALGMLVPGLIICVVASCSSPEWAFVREQGATFLHVLTYSALHTLVLASVVLAISSLAPRRVFALVGTVGFYMLTQALAHLMARMNDDTRWYILGPLTNLRRVAASIFGVQRVVGLRLDWDRSLSWLALAVLLVLVWGILVRQLRRMEAVS